MGDARNCGLRYVFLKALLGRGKTSYFLEEAKINPLCLNYEVLCRKKRKVLINWKIATRTGHEYPIGPLKEN